MSGIELIIVGVRSNYIFNKHPDIILESQSSRVSSYFYSSCAKHDFLALIISNICVKTKLSSLDNKNKIMPD